MVNPSENVRSLVFPLYENNVLLGTKKRGFGEGLWNGFGGKLESTDTGIVYCAQRELRFESGLEKELKEFIFHGRIKFYFQDKPEWNQEVAIFTTTYIPGEFVESEEMRPQEFSVDNLPFNEMFPADQHFLSKILKNINVSGEVQYVTGEKMPSLQEINLSFTDGTKLKESYVAKSQ